MAEVVVPPEKASVMQAVHDVCLMAELAGVERTEAAWVRLLRSARFKFVNLRRDSRGIESIIEAVSVDDEQ